MAFAVASKGAPLASLLNRTLLAASPHAAFALRPASLGAARRLFGSAPFRREEVVFYDVHYRPARDLFAPIPMFFSADVVDPFGESVRLGRTEDGDAVAPRRGSWWVSKEDGDAVHLKVAMPGIAKENVKVSVDTDGCLRIKGESTEDGDDSTGPAQYSSHIRLSTDAFKVDKIEAEMKDGLLKITVPKIKIEPVQIKIE